MDFTEMGARLGLEKEEFIELVDIFVTSADEDIQKLRDAFAANNIDAVKEAAHSLKGSSGNMGFQKISENAAMIEQNARKGSIEGMEAAISFLRKKYEKSDPFCKIFHAETVNTR
jgi:HPt (histidine-containing phosphotransfer) domain-containing protein